MVLNIVSALEALHLSRSQIEALVNLVGVAILLHGDGGLVVAVARIRIFAGVVDVVVILALVNPNFGSTPWLEGVELLHHDV